MVLGEWTGEESEWKGLASGDNHCDIPQVFSSWASLGSATLTEHRSFLKVSSHSKLVENICKSQSYYTIVTQSNNI